MEENYKISSDDGVMASLVCTMSETGQIGLYGPSEIRGFGNGRYEKLLFNLKFDELISYSTMEGISFVVVRKGELWGLIRIRSDFRMFHTELELDEILKKEFIEPIDVKFLDCIGREVKFIENLTFRSKEELVGKYPILEAEIFYIYRMSSKAK